MPLHIFVLTLKGASERRSNLLSSLDKMNFSYELWYGIDGRSGLPPEYEAKIDRPAVQQNLGREMSDAEYACALSHNEIYRSIIARGIPDAIVLEDDACLEAHFEKMVHDLSSSPCELLLLDHRKGRVSRRDLLDLNDQHDAYRVILPPELTTGYYVTGVAAAKMVELTGKISGVADWPCDISTLDCRVVMPRVISQPLEDIANSQIHGQRQMLSTGKSAKRFLSASYWKRWWLKKTGKKLGY